MVAMLYHVISEGLQAFGRGCLHISDDLHLIPAKVHCALAEHGLAVQCDLAHHNALLRGVVEHLPKELHLMDCIVGVAHWRAHCLIFALKQREVKVLAVVKRCLSVADVSSVVPFDSACTYRWVGDVFFACHELNT